MLATPCPVPTAAGWAFEIKFDGVRAIGYATAGGLRLWSRNDREITTSYPEVTRAGLDERLVLDGEVVALNERGRPDFGRLQHRMHVAAPPAGLLAQVAVQYVVFDLLRRQGRSLLTLPYRERRTLLADLDLDRTGALRVPPNFTDIPGSTVLAAADEQCLEGVVAKRMESTYLPGKRSRSWIKTAIRHTHEVIIAGWSPGSGNRRNSIGSLLLAAHDDTGQLVYVGDVGTGFTDAVRARLLEQLRGLERSSSPFPGEVSRGAGLARAGGRAWAGAVGRAPAGRRDRVPGVHPRRELRHPSWRGLRPDRDPPRSSYPHPKTDPGPQTGAELPALDHRARRSCRACTGTEFTSSGTTDAPTRWGSPTPVSSTLDTPRSPVHELLNTLPFTAAMHQTRSRHPAVRDTGLRTVVVVPTPKGA